MNIGQGKWTYGRRKLPNISVCIQGIKHQVFLSDDGRVPTRFQQLQIIIL